MKKTQTGKARGLALLPFLVFVGIYLGAALYSKSQGGESGAFPAVTAMFLAVLLTFCMTKGSIRERFSIFARGAANEDILTMMVIYLLAGAFSSTVAAMGGLEATIHLGMKLVPVHFLAAGMFAISAFMGTATGTSVGTISAIVPIAVGMADQSGLSLPLMVGACVGGAMFGDNLSMISDTTIAATHSQGCEMRDKFRVNFFIALPAAAITVLILLFAGRPETLPALPAYEVSFVKVLPYLLVLALALAGVNVFLVLTIGIFSAGLVGMATASLNLFTFAQSIWSGFTGMNEVFFLTLLCGGMSAMVAHNGGILWLIEKLRVMIRGPRSAQLGIASLVSLADCATANNTVAIVVVGGMVRDISREYHVDPRRSASLLDVFSCVFQGLIPYGAQLLVASSLTAVYGAALSPAEIIPGLWYCWALALVAVLSIYIPFADGVTRKNPWNWEYGCAQSDVEKKKAERAAASAADPF